MSYQHYFQTEHDQIRQITRRFVEREMMPFVDAWEEAGSFPRELYQKAAKVGILGMGYPEALGGTPGDLFMQIAVWEELMRPGSGGLSAGLGSLHIALPPILALGSPEQQEQFIRPVLAGERIAALAVTEPGGGSDVAGLATTAVLQNDHYIVNGSKTFITSGCRADLVTTAVRTGGPGSHGISLLVIEADTPGFSRSQPLKKMGWWASDTAQLFFDDCGVPAGNLIGAENMGFYAIMGNFQKERLQMSIVANMTAELALTACLDYVQQREAFGRPIAGFQVMRHKLVDMATELEVSREFTYRVAAKMNDGVDQVKEVSMAKLFATKMCDMVTYEAVQIFGGYGYMREYLVERLYRDSRILSIGGGTTEIMKEIVAKRIF
ncbi:MAG: acyl-CoA dehydrogenase family protein [Ardenticatenaceae bacterium]|nr:acyl-CoA dehydrogenase family protein [Ardenticatenaceae bacterium]